MKYISFHTVVVVIDSAWCLQSGAEAPEQVPEKALAPELALAQEQAQHVHENCVLQLE